MRLIETTGGPMGICKTYYQHAYNEYVVKFLEHGRGDVKATYHTDDKRDALATALNMAHGV